jgi:hypothetical protein
MGAIVCLFVGCSAFFASDMLCIVYRSVYGVPVVSTVQYCIYGTVRIQPKRKNQSLVGLPWPLHHGGYCCTA